MLIFKADKDLKELEKFGFKPKYSENTGEIIAYEKIGKSFDGVRVKKEIEQKKIRIIKRPIKEIWEIARYSEYFDIETVYDLTKAGLIDKY